MMRMLDKLAIIIGAMKSGTTSLFLYLQQHPEINGHILMEPDFFSVDENWRKGWDWYLDGWGGKVDEYKILLEASTSYTKAPLYENTVERIFMSNLNPKLIYIMRNPLKRIESHYWFMLFGRNKKVVPLKQGFDPSIVSVSKYAYQLDRFTGYFSKDNILLIQTEELNKNPNLVLERVCKYLNIDPQFKFKNINIKHGDKEALNTTFFYFLRKSDILRKIVRNVFPYNLKYSILKFSTKIFPDRVKRHEYNLSPEMELKIRKMLRDDMERLRDHYGVDISLWGF